jgi:hypothetical protein
MSEEHLPGAGITAEGPHIERTTHENGNRMLPQRERVLTQFKDIRDQGTELFSTAGILALAAIETADVVGRAAGRLFYDSTTDGSRAAFELVHELSRTSHDIVVDTTQIAVDTVTEVGSQLVRGATHLVRQGRELADLAAEAGGGVFRLAMGLMRQPERSETKPVAAVPIIVN